MNNSVKFWDKTAEPYSKQPIADEAAYQKKLQVTRKYLKPDMEVLEFGCGTGATAIAHAPYVKHIQAIDFSSKMIEIARSKAETNKIENDIDRNTFPFPKVLPVVSSHLFPRTRGLCDAHRIIPDGCCCCPTMDLGNNPGIKNLLPIKVWLLIFDFVRQYQR